MKDNQFKVYYDNDADLGLIRGKKVAIIGYGSQGHAHALNLKESEVDVVVGLKKESPSRSKAEKAGLKVMTPAEAARFADVVMMLVPDEVAQEVYESDVKPHITPGKYLAFAHGFNVHFGKITPPPGVEVFLAAPKGPGHMVRRQFVEGKGVPALVATLSGEESTKKLALSYAKAIGGTRAGVFETTFREETETDLFGEQAVLCGGLTQLIRNGFETLVSHGYSPVMAYFECVHEMKLIVDLIYEGGLAHMRRSISNTAEYGDYTVGPMVVDSSVRQKMDKVLARIQKGEFADEWLQEARSGGKNLNEFRQSEQNSLMETVGAQLRERMGCVLKK
jgi:ketol-acid reductoisomerase